VPRHSSEDFSRIKVSPFKCPTFIRVRVAPISNRKLILPFFVTSWMGRVIKCNPVSESVTCVTWCSRAVRVAFVLQGNIGNPLPPILLIFGYVVAYRKIRDTYFFCGKSYLAGEKSPSKVNSKNSFLKISSVVIEIFRKFKIAFEWRGGFHPLNSFFRKKNTCLLFFDKLQHIQKSAKSKAEGCLCSLVKLFFFVVTATEWFLLADRSLPVIYSFASLW